MDPLNNYCNQNRANQHLSNYDEVKEALEHFRNEAWPFNNIAYTHHEQYERDIDNLASNP